MREILFRGKTKDGEWVEGFLFKYDCEYCIAEDDIRVSDYELSYYWYDVVDPETVGQYTGLTANGKKIFEGDIVKVERDLWHGENKKEREVFNGVVWYDEKHTCFGLKSEKYRCLPIARFKGDYSTVIGNVHDNPELMKGEQ